MDNIEVEVRSFVSKEKYDELVKFFGIHASWVRDDYQETWYFDAPVDVRIQKNDFFAKIWLKKGKLHDTAREEVEIKCSVDDFDKLGRLFEGLGYSVSIKWFRKRKEFLWGDVSVCLDDTKGYGSIIELEVLSSSDKKDKVLVELQEKMRLLGIPITPREEFDAAYHQYKNHWRVLVGKD